MIKRIFLITKHPTCILADEATDEIAGVDGESYLDNKKIDKVTQEKKISCTTAEIIH